MSVLIKGMEMPKPKLADMATVYYAYVLVRPNGHAAIVVDNEDGLDSTEFPLVPVPPHGRLIDADALINEFKILQSGREIFGMELDSSFLSSGQELSTEWYCVEDAIEDAPTIIDAEDMDLQTQREYEAATEYAQYCERYEPTYDPDTGAM